MPPKGEVFVRTESPKGELAYYIVSDGGRSPLSYACTRRIVCQLTGPAAYDRGRFPVGCRGWHWQYRYRARRG